MPDPVTVGTLAVGALSMTAEALLKGAVGEAVKDAYKALKAKVSHCASGDLVELEKAPSSRARQAVIAEIIDAQSQADRESVRLLVETLVTNLKAGAGPIGLDIGRLTALDVELGDVTVTSGIGARIESATIRNLKTGGISVGDHSEK